MSIKAWNYMIKVNPWKVSKSCWAKQEFLPPLLKSSRSPIKRRQFCLPYLRCQETTSFAYLICVAMFIFEASLQMVLGFFGPVLVIPFLTFNPSGLSRCFFRDLPASYRSLPCLVYHEKSSRCIFFSIFFLRLFQKLFLK